jgi:hypothetical protein
MIDVYTPEPLPLFIAGPYAGYTVAAEPAARDIGFHPRVSLRPSSRAPSSTRPNVDDCPAPSH